MANRLILSYSQVTDYNQSGEDTLAATLTGKEYGWIVIFNTTLSTSRIWDGTAFISNPTPPACVGVYVAKTATYTATASDYTIDCTSGTFTVTLPTAVGITGRIYVVKNSGAGTITVDGNGTETIDGNLTITLAQFSAATLQSTGSGWIII